MFLQQPAESRLGECGILTEEDRVELLEGWIVPKMNHNPIHDGTIELCRRHRLGHLEQQQVHQDPEGVAGCQPRWSDVSVANVAQLWVRRRMQA